MMIPRIAVFMRNRTRVQSVARDLAGLDAAGPPLSYRDRAVRLPLAARALTDGAIVAIKGLGGYHLACRADDAGVVATIASCKHRDDKPFAVMVRSIRRARTLVALSPTRSRLLRAALARPFFSSDRDADGGSAAEVAPGRTELGLMLPYTPVHHLLLARVESPLVMTSGNRSDEPIAFRDHDALERSGPSPTSSSTHDRPHRMPVATIRSFASWTSRGAPSATVRPPLPRIRPGPACFSLLGDAPVLAVGGQLKNTACVARGGASDSSAPHVGDLGEAGPSARGSLASAQLTQLGTRRRPIVATICTPTTHRPSYALARHDLTPYPFNTITRIWRRVSPEPSARGPAIGSSSMARDSGLDGTIWGGEILAGDLGASSASDIFDPCACPAEVARRSSPGAWRAAGSPTRIGAQPPVCSSLVIDHR